MNGNQRIVNKHVEKKPFISKFQKIFSNKKEKNKVEFVKQESKAKTTEKPKKVLRKEFVEMIDRIKKQKKLRTYFIVICSFVLLYWIVSPVVTLVQLRYQVSTMKEQIRELQIENKVLEEELNKVNTPLYIEEIARKELGMVKGGENPVYINETKEMKREVTNRLKSNEKIGIYLKDWYESWSEWFEKEKIKK